MKQFHGDIDELKKLVEQLGYKGDWEYSNLQKKHSFRSRAGEILNWYEGKGTIQYQGKNQEAFCQKLSSQAPNEALAQTRNKDTSKPKIFIVHGHDRDTRDQLELILHRLELSPFVLQNNDSGGLTIIEALEKHMYGASDFAIILMTPDDYGYPKSKSEADRQPRARQNVILEAGMVLASLGRERMVILKKGNLEIPSDLEGIIHLEFNDRIQEVALKLVQRLQGAGIQVDSQKISDAAA